MATNCFDKVRRKTIRKSFLNFVKLSLMSAALILITTAFASAQPRTPSNPNAPKNGNVKGTIFIKNISGNIGNSLRCYHLIVDISPSMSYAAEASGDIKTGQCSYFIIQVKPDQNFVLTIPKPALFKKFCDTSAFEVDGMYPQKIKPSETRVVNLMIRKAACTQLK
ncbi:MAG: hypothetical protein ABJB34_06640 [Acidobacteriota bacterium]